MRLFYLDRNGFLYLFNLSCHLYFSFFQGFQFGFLTAFACDLSQLFLID